MAMRKIRKKFTEEQVNELRSNKFTYDASPYTIQFTLEFKNLFIARYESGEPAKSIFEDLELEYK